MNWLDFDIIDGHVAFISVTVTVLVNLFILYIKWKMDKSMINYKLKKEYLFNQGKGIKEKLAQSKTQLIKATEELNHRLWNFSDNIGKGWHKVNIENPLWKKPENCYYLKSFAYRFLVFLHYVELAEKNIYGFDFSAASKTEKLYLKYIKVLKHFFCDASLLKDLNYDNFSEKSHLFTNKIHDYISFIMEKDDIISYDRFTLKISEDFEPIRPIIKLISDINDSVDRNANINLWYLFHLFIIIFLNKYGLDYQYTKRKKFQGLIENNYRNKIQIKNSLFEFFEKNKIIGEVNWILEDLYSKPKWLTTYIWLKFI